MAITLVERPQGHLLGTTANQATVSSSSGALFTKATHGLVDGDFIYIISNVRNYCGFWYVDQQTVNTFTILEYLGATPQAYVNNDTITYYKAGMGPGAIQNHYWNAVHLPIIYKFTSNLWPTNSVDTVRTVTSAVSSTGYTKLTISGAIKATGSAAELDFVKFTVNSVEGIYQIIQYISSTQFVIDLIFTGTNVYGNIQFYYNNYHGRFKIYAGLPPTHIWAAQKPYLYMAEIKEVPDATGLIVLNINEYIKSQIDILSNDLLLGTLPNDINSFCEFYVTYAESYDLSTDSYTVGSYLSAYTDDSATPGIAVNAKLPFKNRYSGYMSEYIGLKRKFLTLFDQPTIFTGFYFEIDFLIEGDLPATYGTGGALWFKVERYINSIRQSYSYTKYQNWDLTGKEGLYRIPVSVTGSEDRIDVTLISSVTNPPVDGADTTLSEVKTINVNSDCSAQSMQFIWKNYLGGHDSFVFTTLKEYGFDISSTKESSKSILGTWPNSWGENADTVNREIERISNQTVTVYSQNLTETEIDGLAYLKTSPLVQIMNSKFDKRTVIIDKSSFVKKKDGDKTYFLTFRATYTDNVPAQSL